VNLIGEHTDYNEGFALPFGIDRSTVAALHLRADRSVRLATDFAAGIVETELDSLTDIAGLGWAAHPVGVAWALGQFGAELAPRSRGATPGLSAAWLGPRPLPS